MSRSYKKFPCVRGKGRKYSKFMKNYSNRALRRMDHDCFPRGKTSRIRYYNVDPWSICDYTWRKSFEQWMVDREREYQSALETIEKGWNAYYVYPAGSTYTEWNRDKDGIIIDERKIVRTKDEFSLLRWTVDRACRIIAKGRPKRKLEYPKWRKAYLAK